MKKTDPKKQINTKTQDINHYQEQIQELNSNWKRALADYQNLERRVQEEKEDMIVFLKANIISKLLPSLDNLEKVSQHSTDEGLILSIKTIFEALKGEGLQEIEALGKQFDPHTMEAIQVKEGNQDDKVIEIMEKGYMLADKIIRPAKVVVSKKSIN